MKKRNEKTVKAGICFTLFVVVGIIMAASLSGCLEQQVAEKEKQYATFEITPTGGTTCLLKSDKNGFTVPAYANKTGHTLIQTDNSTAWTNPVATFEIEPVMFKDATNKDLAYLEYSVYNPDITIDTTTDSYYLFTKTDGNRQIVWNDSGSVDYVSGSTQLGMTDNVTLVLTFTVNQGSMSRIENTYSSVKVQVKFSNGQRWSKVYDVDFTISHSWGG